MERIRQSFRRRKNKDKNGDKKFDFQTVFSEAESEEPKPLTRLQKIRKSIRSIKKKKKQSIDENLEDQQENEKISLDNEEDTDFAKDETEEDPLDKKSKFRLSFRSKKNKDKNIADEIDTHSDKDNKEKKKKKKKKGSSKWETDEERVRSNHCEFKVKYLGFIEVDESRGMEVCEAAIKELLQTRKKSTKGKLHVTGDGLRVVDKKGGMLVDQVIEKVSFCAPDRNHHHGFAYISRDGTSRRWLCHGFMSRQEGGERLSHAVGVAFAVCLENKQAREREGVTSTYNEEDGTFTRFGSFRQGTITERLQNPQEFRESSEKNVEVVENPFAIARPRPGDARASMRAIGIKGASPFKRGVAEYSSLRVNELPSNISRKEKSRVSLILEENFENEETKNEINEMILQMSRAKGEEPRSEELMATSMTSDFSESSTTTNPPSIAKTPDNATCESNNNKVGQTLAESAAPPLPLDPPPVQEQDSDNPWDLVPDQPKIKNHSRSNSKHENIKSEMNNSNASCTNQGDAWLASLSNKISSLEEPPTSAWHNQPREQEEEQDPLETEWAALAARNDSKHVKNNNPFIAFV